MRRLTIQFVSLIALTLSLGARAESQNNEYRGVQDPFGDPSNYEFSEDEQEDKEFFHLGRYLMLGVDVGAAVFTGGLGSTVSPGFYVGGRMVYFFDRAFALEFSGHYSNHLDTVLVDSARGVEFDTNVISLGLGFRYYFDTKSAPKAIAIANPYLAFGGGVYMRDQRIVDRQGLASVTDSNTNGFGANAGGGVEFAIVKRHIYLGGDLRYHLVFFPDESDTFGGALPAGARGGDYFTLALTLTYNF